MSWSVSDAGLYGILNALNKTMIEQQQASLRMSTGLKINRAADDPAGLIALSQLSSELTAVQAASENGVRANAMMNVADAALAQIEDLVADVQDLALELANDTGLSESEKEAKQLAIDLAVASIDRLVGTTTYNGKQLLNGTYAIRTSGVDSGKITDVDIHSRPPGSEALDLEVEITDVAEKAVITHSGATLTGSVSIEVAGNLGSVTLSFASGTTMAAVASSVNAAAAGTGVQAVASNNVLYLRSEHYGEDEFVSIDVISGSFSTTGGVSEDYGEDAEVTINGQNAGVNGLNVTFNVNDVSGTLTLSESFATTASGSEEFEVAAGGATFALSPSASNTFTIGISSLGSTSLGNGTLGYLHQITSSGEYSAIDHAGQASRIAEAATLQVARTRATVGSFQTYTIGSMQNLLADTEESLSSAISDIGDTDYAYETAMAARRSIMMQAQIAALSLISQQKNLIIGLLS